MEFYRTKKEKGYLTITLLGEFIFSFFNYFRDRNKLDDN